MSALVERSIWSALATLATIIGRLWSGIIVARLLGPGGVGELAFLTFVCEYMYVLSNRGFSNGLTRYIAQLHGGDRDDEIAGFTHWVYRQCSVACLLGCILLTAFVGWNGSTQHQNAFFLRLCVIVAFALGFFASVKTAEYTGMLQFRSLAVINAISAILLIITQSAGTLLLGVTGALLGYAIGALPLTLLIFWGLSPAFRSIPPTLGLKRQFRTYTRSTWIGHIVSAVVWGRIEVFFIERYWNSHEVGLFTAALTLSSIAIYGPVLLRGACVPHFANLLGAGDRKSIDRAYGAGTRLMALIAFPIALGGAAIVPALLPILYGDQFRHAVPLAVVLTGMSCLTFAGVGSALVYGIGYTRFVALVEGAAGAASVAACFLVIPHYGAWGAVWVRAGVQTAIIVFQTVYITFGLNYRVPYLYILKTLCAAMVCAATAWGVILFLPHAAAIPMAIVLGSVVYVLSVRYLGAARYEDLAGIVRGGTLGFGQDAAWRTKLHSFFAWVGQDDGRLRTHDWKAIGPESNP